MSTKTKIHRGLQILFTLVILGPIFGKLTQNPQLVETFIRLGYPLFLTQILGIAYLLGIVGIWQPKSPVLREWAYAGFTFALLGAVVSHLAAGDPFGKAVPALLMLAVLTGAHWMGRKASSEEE